MILNLALPILSALPPDHHMGTRDLSSNYLAGPIPTLPIISTWRLSINFLSGLVPVGTCHAFSFDGNCFTLPSGCAEVVQWQEASCNTFCGVSYSAEAAASPCDGRGVCVPDEVTLAPTCLQYQQYLRLNQQYLRFYQQYLKLNQQYLRFHQQYLSLSIIPPTTLLTKETQKETGGKFTADPVPLFVYGAGQAVSGCGVQLAFQANFTFSLAPQSGRAGNNGFAFVVSATDRVGKGSGVGYGGMDTRSMAVEFDTLQDKLHGDMSSPHVGLNIQGQDQSKAAAKSPFVPTSRKAYTVWVDYEPGELDTIQVFLAATEVKPAQLLLERRLALCEVLQVGAEQRAFFFGFVASTTVKPFQMHLILKSAVHTGASWAYAVVASVEAAYGIALNSEAPWLSVDSLFAAMELTSLTAKCMAGGSSTAAFHRLITLPSGGLTTDSKPTFKHQDPACYTGNLDHAVLVVGYLLFTNNDRQSQTAPPFWIIRNSWGVEWGDRGHMRMDIQGGVGVCGINMLPGIYPIVKIPKDPCGQKSYKGNGDLQPSMNPTASMLIITGANWWCSDVFPVAGISLAGFSSQNMSLPQGKVIKLGGTPTTPCTAFFYALKVSLAKKINFFWGSSTPLPSSPLSSPLQLTHSPISPSSPNFPPSFDIGNTCSSISVQLGLASTYLASLNPGLDCFEPIKAGRSLCIEPNATFAFTVPWCLQYGMLSSQDTCESLQQQSMNSSREGSTGAEVVAATSWTELYRSNPGIIGPRTIPASSATIASGASTKVRGGG
ncbi:unnamed protein product [Closterium sp. NIES-65]|nr:unnamed protein product [Closterium sp. NIES-65]